MFDEIIVAKREKGPDMTISLQKTLIDAAKRKRLEGRPGNKRRRRGPTFRELKDQVKQLTIERDMLLGIVRYSAKNSR